MATALFDRLRRESDGFARRRVASGGLAGYELGRLIAAGSGGEVYLARQLGAAQRTVALKRLAHGANSAVVARLRREGEILASLDHPHIVRIYELVPDGDGVAIAMQYALGGSLADRLSRHGRLSPAQVVALASRCADALASAHRRGVLHRDVKPANILFTSDGEPLVSDFGVARWEAASGLTGPGMTLGTAGYIDPDVVDGSEADVRSDVYSLGVVCYEALVGAPPFRGGNELAVMKAADRGQFIALSDAVPGIPPALAAAVERAMARRPGRRFADCEELARALRGVRSAGHLSRSGDDPRPYPPSRVARTEASEAPEPPASVAPTGLFGPRPPAPAVPKRRRLDAVRRWRPQLDLRIPRAIARRVAGRCRRAFRVPARRALMVGALLAAVAVVYAARPSPAARPAHGDVQATFSGNVIELQNRAGRPVARFVLGDSGDIALLGDWHCRGNRTPAIYRPSTGQVFVFDSWANPDRAVTSSSTTAARPNGRPVVVRSPADCDHIEVRDN